MCTLFHQRTQSVCSTFSSKCKRTFINVMNRSNKIPKGCKSGTFCLFSLSVTAQQVWLCYISSRQEMRKRCIAPFASQGTLRHTYIHTYSIRPDAQLVSCALSSNKCNKAHYFPTIIILNPEHLVVLLAGPFSHTSTQYMILSIFYISMDLSTNYFVHFSGC